MKHVASTMKHVALSFKSLWNLNEMFAVNVITSAYRILFFLWGSGLLILCTSCVGDYNSLRINLSFCLAAAMWASIGLTIRLCFESCIIFFNIHDYIKNISETLKCENVSVKKQFKQKVTINESPLPINTQSSITAVPTCKAQPAGIKTETKNKTELRLQDDLNGLVLKVF